MRFILACVMAVAVSSFATVGTANAASLAGAWSGGGTVKLKTGQVERVRCRVRYSKSSGKTFGVSATCATTAGTISQSGRVVQVRGNRYSGRLYNADYAVSGRISISVSGKRQTVTVTSSKGSGRLSLSRR